MEIVSNKQQQDDMFNNNNSSKPLLRSASSDDAKFYCDRCSIDTTITEYLLPEDYVLGTFPKELVETKIPSRQNSVSSRTLTHKSSNDNQCSHKQCNATSHSTMPIQPHTPSKSSHRYSLYDNIPLELEEELSNGRVTPPVSPPHTEKDSTSAARLELDAVLHDLLININNLDLDADDSTSLSDIFSYSQTAASTVQTESSDTASHHLQTDSAIVSPTSEELSSLPATPRAPSTPYAPISPDTEPLPADRLESSEELTGADLDADDGEEGEEGIDGELRETIWRERRDSGVGSSLTREPL